MEILDLLLKVKGSRIPIFSIDSFQRNDGKESSTNIRLEDAKNEKSKYRLAGSVLYI